MERPSRFSERLEGFHHQKWEYLTVFVRANLSNPGAQEFVESIYPEGKAPIYAPESMVPDLNWWGEQGWELVHMQPVLVGYNGDVLISSEGRYTNVYFCVLKRPRY
jgi:hypothetical protein